MAKQDEPSLAYGKKHSVGDDSIATPPPPTTTTTIEGIFCYELTFIKLCGGFLFETPPKFLRILYQASIILLTKFFATNYYSMESRQVANQIKQASVQNVKLFRVTYLVVSYVIVFVNFFTALKYNKILLIILKKRLDKRYLDQFEWLKECNHRLVSSPSSSSSSGRAGIGASLDLGNSNERSLPSDKFDTSSSTLANLVAPIDTGTPGRGEQVAAQNMLPHPLMRANLTSSLRTRKKTGAHRTRMVRILLIANLLLNTFTSYLWHNIGSNNSSSSSSSSSSLTLTSRLLSQPISQVVNQSSSPATFEGLLAFTSPAPINGDFIELPLTLPPKTMTTTIMTSAKQQQQQQRQQQQQPNPVESGSDSSAFDRLQQTLFPDWSRSTATISWNSQNLLRFALSTLVNLAKLLYEFSQAALNINQTYGQLFVVLIIVTTLTDMLSYSRLFDALVREEKLIKASLVEQCDFCSTPTMVKLNHDKLSTSPNSFNNKRALRQRRGSTLLTTELLVQIRDVLIVLRCTSSLNYLGALIFDLTRIGTVFCQLYTAIASDSQDSVLFLIIQYLLVLFSMALSVLGYHWLHQEVLDLRRFIEEKNLLECSTVIDESVGRYYSETESIISQPERITTCRLADDIGNLWPTDWFTPDFKSYLKSNILVITLVATLQQLVEAGMKNRGNTGS